MAKFNPDITVTVKNNEIIILRILHRAMKRAVLYLKFPDRKIHS